MKGKHGAAAAVRHDSQALADRAQEAERKAERLAIELVETRKSAARQAEAAVAERRALVVERDAAEGPRVRQLNAENERLRQRIDEVEADREALQKTHDKLIARAAERLRQFGMSADEAFETIVKDVSGRDVVLRTGMAKSAEAQLRIGLARGDRGPASVERLRRARGQRDDEADVSSDA